MAFEKSDNLFIGDDAGLAATSGARNIVIGKSTDTSGATATEIAERLGYSRARIDAMTAWLDGGERGLEMWFRGGIGENEND